MQKTGLIITTEVNVQTNISIQNKSK